VGCKFKLSESCGFAGYSIFKAEELGEAGVSSAIYTAWSAVARLSRFFRASPFFTTFDNSAAVKVRRNSVQ